MREMMAIAILTAVSSATFAMEPLVLAEEQRVRSPGTITLTFDLPEIPKGQQVRLGLDARVDWPGLDGSNPWMVVAINGRNLLLPDLLNKPPEFTMRCGMDTTWAYGTAWRLCYSPDFSDKLRTLPMPLGIPDCDPYHFVWDITPYATAGKNTAQFTHLHLLSQGTTMVLRHIRAEVGEPMKSMAGGAATPAPTGPLPTYVARGKRPVSMSVDLSSGGSLRLRVSGRTLELTSRTSEPEGKWITTSGGAWTPIKRGGSATVRWKGTAYEVTRRVTTRDDHVHVADTITNTGQELVGLIHENRLALEQKPVELLLGGRPVFSETQESWEPAHPSAMARWKDLTVGLIAEDDVFRVHIRSFAESGIIGLADPQLGIASGKSHTLEWSIYPVPNGDYWDFINAVRRNWGSNFTIPGPMVFDPEGSADGSKSFEYYCEWAKRRGVKWIISGQTEFKDGYLAEGTAIPMAKEWMEAATAWTQKLHQCDPSLKTLLYLHSQICTEPNADKLYADCKVLDAEGKQLTSPYRYPVYIYLPTLENAYGKALFKALVEMLDRTKADGIYNDEMEYASSSYAYSAPWDGCTVTMDPKTHTVTGMRSSVVLLQLPWKVAMVKYLRDRGKVIMGNGPPHTRTMLQLKIPRFTELASYSFLIETHLNTPWALANHEAQPGDRGRATMARRALDYGGILDIYTWGDSPTGEPFVKCMYPITPTELHPGVVLAEERILTNRSGRFGWPDSSSAEVYVFNSEGKRVDKPNVKTVREGSRLLTEVRIPGDRFAVLVRR